MSERLDRYFALEAADYLEQLETLLASGGRPDLDQLLRLSRGVRGSAQMAGADSVAAVAERLEEGLRSIQDGHVVWSEEVRQLSLKTVEDLRLLVRASSRWGELEEERVRSAMRRWQEVERAPPEAPTRDWPDDEDEEPVLPSVSAHRATLAPEVAIESLFYNDDGPHVLTSDQGDDMNHHTTAAVPDTVPVESLLLDRNGALREALAMRDGLERAMRGVPGAEVELASTVRELFELLEIAAAGAASPG